MPPTYTTATDRDIDSFLAVHPSWARNGAQLERVVQGESYRQLQALLNRICDLAEEANHHPDLTLRYHTLAILLTTHDASGLTTLDLSLAAAIELTLAG